MGERGQSSGMVFEFEVNAARGDTMPDGLPVYDQLLYQAMAHLYARYRTGTITRDRAAKDKGRLLYEWEQNRKRMESAASLARWHADLRRSIEGAHEEYRRNPSMETAENLSKTLDGILRE